MNYFKNIMMFSLLSVPLYSYATVGGKQSIEVLGYEAKEQKLYVLRHYEDERGRLPQLYYYQLNGKTPEKLIEVQSLYINPKTKKVDYDQNDIQFEKDLKKITKRLTPLLSENIKTAKINTLATAQKKVPSWYDPDEKIDEYKTTYQVLSANMRSEKHIATHYDHKLTISQSFIIPKQNKALVVVQYYGIPFETGYDIEDPVLLVPKSKYP